MADPYEQQLLAVFESCDVNDTGQLDSNGLIQLCDQLHLEDGREQLMDCLLPAFTFYQFRDALLTLLGSSRQTSDTDREPSPEREVSPKFVFGQKKYGRRSRPESAEQESDNDDESDITNDLADNTIFLPFGYEENSKTKPCTLLIDDCQLETQSAVTPTSVQSVVLEKEEVESPRGQGEAELRLAAQRLGIGTDGYLDPLELSSVCRAVGMEKMADEVVKQVFAKLKVNSEGRISFTEFLQLFRSTHTATPPPSDTRSLPCTPPLYQQSSLTSLDTFSSGYVSSDTLVDLWEAGGVVSAGSLLMDLGLTSTSEVNMSSLSTTLEEEIRSMASKSVSTPSPQINTLTAALVLSQVQLKWTRCCLEQMTGERDKLHVDLAEANQRATLLAQEVDDRHARMERTSQMQIKMLEKRHAEQVKQLSLQLAVDRDQLTAATLRLEKKLAGQQEEEAKLRAGLNTLQAEFEAIEKDNQNLIDKLAACDLIKNKSEKDEFEIQQLQQKVQELEARSERVPSLLQQLASLQAENTTLRDRNDELTVQVENLSARPICKRQNSSTSLESGVGGGTKRRGNSPLALPPEHLWDEESPRLGKVRRYCTDPDLSLESVPMEGLAIRRTLHHSESGLEADLDTLDNSFTMSSPSVDKITFNIGGSDDAYISEIDRLRCTVAELQQENKEYRKKLAVTPLCDSSPQKNPNKLAEEEIKCSSSSLNTLETESTEVQTSLEASQDVDQLEKRCYELRNTLESVQREILKILSEKRACNEENCVLKQKIEELSETLPVSKSFGDEHLSVENSSGPLTYTISNVPNSREDVPNMESVFSHSIKDSSDNVALKCFPFMNHTQTNSDSPYCLFPKDKRDPSVFKFENLSQFAFELSQSLNDSNLTGDFFSTNLGCEPLSLSFSDKESSPVNSKVEKSLDTCDKTVSLKKEDLTKNPQIEKYECLLKENEDLKVKCTELETSLELMRVEYEKCEDYWQGKLNEERTIFEQEQRLSDEKFTELEDKIQEYAELFGSDDGKTSGRLPTIDERDSLERQVTDLEEEFEEFKRISKMETQLKTEKIESLQLELQNLQNISSQIIDTQDASVQVSEITNEFRLHQPHSNPNPKICIPALEVTTSDCCCSCHTMSRRVLTRLRESKTQLQTECDMLHRRREIILHQLSQLHQRTNLVYTPMPDRRLASDVEMFHNLSSRLRYQELRCRHLQSALKHHHQKTDKLLQNAWDQYRADLSSIEKNFQNCQEKLQHQSKLCKQQMERLAASDILVKDLYKENAHLISQVQKLEEQNLFVDQSIMNSRV